MGERLNGRIVGGWRWGGILSRVGTGDARDSAVGIANVRASDCVSHFMRGEATGRDAMQRDELCGESTCGLLGQRMVALEGRWRCEGECMVCAMMATLINNE